MPHQLTTATFVAELQRRKRMFQNSSPIVGMDICDTVKDTRYRMRHMLEKSLANVCASPECIAIAKEFPIEQVPYNEQELWEAFAESLPSSARDREVLGQAHDVFISACDQEWEQGNHLHADVPYPGVAQLLRWLLHSGFQIAYISGRPIKTMGATTVKLFVEHGLPIGVPGVHFVLKPDRDEKDWLGSITEFKIKSIKRLGQYGCVLALVDNEVTTINRVVDAFPTIMGVHFRSIWKPSPEPLRSSAYTLSSYG